MSDTTPATDLIEVRAESELEAARIVVAAWTAAMQEALARADADRAEQEAAAA